MVLNTVVAAVAATLTALLMACDQPMEKVYGMAKAGQNDRKVGAGASEVDVQGVSRTLAAAKVKTWGFGSLSPKA